MPTYRGITIQLHSQFDIDTFPEYVPKPQEYYTEHGITAQAPLQIDEKTSSCSVYIAVFPGSTFWLSYSVAPPVPEDQLFVFKLFINSAHIVTWSTDKEHEWTGKTMFGLFEREEDGQEGRKRIEKRALRFTAPDGIDGAWKDVPDAFDEVSKIEIRVHRASGKKRTEWETEQYSKTAHGKSPRGVDLVGAGRAGGDHPKRFYKFALIDQTNQPFVTFRYYYRTWEQIRYLGLIDGECTDNEMSVIEPFDVDGLEIHEKEKRKNEEYNATREILDSGNDAATSHPRAYIPTGAPGSSSTTAYRPHPAYPKEGWGARTPSPVSKSIRELISTTPLLGKKRGFAPSSLVKVMTGTWKRRGMPSSENSSERDSGNSPRSVS
ncbi:hypothetical protein K504DRAFT_423337 [Pleomassaria siparia CBS 279.74]|uniref:DUF7918 domain-containing protein n=1 Tax=Pleomassaria siparia CBS 279.74 TaxID=1314801 RepID=A0A6G1KJR8_9PLEO|nr:hypothetical protein K504DRAFT_423337 [Pleomassaria siparia CBS 279.74]